ncbi:MAG: stage III sporulation protein AE [Clostridia bacterium]|nr:stage III sporulation protein AE [Clostridia bacterium]
MNGRHMCIALLVLISSVPGVVAAVGTGEGVESKPEDEQAAAIIGELQEEIDRLVDESDFSQWQAALDRDGLELAEICDGSTVKDLVQALAYGEANVDIEAVFGAFGGSLRDALLENMGIVLALLGVGLLSGLADVLISGGKDSPLSEVAGFLCLSAAIGVVVFALSRMTSIARNGIVGMVDFIELANPTLAAMLTASGSAMASGAISPLMAFLASAVAKLIETIVLPLALTSGVLSVMNNLSSKSQIGELQRLSADACKWSVGLVFTLYVGVAAITGLAISSTNGLSLRTAKFAVERFVPIIGGAASGTIDTVLFCAHTVKNAAGVASIIITIACAAAPLLKLLGVAIALKVSSALCEPIADRRIVLMLREVGDTSKYLIAAVFGVLLMFVITAGIIVGTGNIYMA